MKTTTFWRIDVTSQDDLLNFSMSKSIMSCANGRTGGDPQLQTEARASRVTMLMMISAFDIPVNIANSCATRSTKKTTRCDLQGMQ